MTDLRDRLQGALGSAYRVEKELGGGGMSRVFLAEEVELGRRVVVKVLPPDMAAGVNVDRFRREIQLAARLQHPHIVPLLSAGASGDLLYYVMPFIEGESLRAKLAREGELPVAEALRILREVLDALAYAHGHHVVHRDIKPDNVLLSGKHALVTDFGVAKAVAESTGKQTLTSMGVALGTPAYMAPEQATADPHTDHRADIYAVGALAYEMLSGRPPFMALNAQAMLAAHVTEVPEPLTKHRTAVPEALNQLILRCLEKKPADRWQRAEELLPNVEALLTPTGGITPTGTQPVISSGTAAAIRRGHPLRVAGLFALASLAVLGVVYFVMMELGLPDWVLLGAIALLAAGLPIMLVTGHVERRRAMASSTGIRLAEPESKLHGWLNWRSALMGGGIAFAGLAVVAGGYSAMRVMGIGPVGTLVATGVLAERDLLIVADFENRTADSSLGPSITEAFRIDLGQSPVVKIMDAAAMAAALRRMNRDESVVLNSGLARELAQREGVKAVVAGDIGTLGRGYVLSARVLSAADGAELAALRESAADDAAIIGAVDRLSGRLRERLGESLKTIRASEPLEQVTTASLDALQRYTQAVRAFDRSDYRTAIPLLEEAIALDSTFAMAHRKLAVSFSNTQAGRSRVIAASRKAFQHRHRLPPKERYLAEAWYYNNVEIDSEKQAAAYRSVLQLDPEQTTALTNLALLYIQTRRYAEAEALALRAIALGDAAPYYVQAMAAQVAQGNFAAAETTLARFARRLPDAPILWRDRANFALAKGDFLSAAAYFDSLLRRERSPEWRVTGLNGLANVALVRGRLAESQRLRKEAMAVQEARGVLGGYIQNALPVAQVELRLRDDPQAALREVEAALARHPLSKIAATDRPYTPLAVLYAEAGRVEVAKRMMAEYVREVDEALRRELPVAAGRIALAEGRLGDALDAFRRLRDVPVPAGAGGPLLEFSALAEVFDRLGETDSALAYYERFVTTPFMFVGNLRPMLLGPTYKRLGELYEQRGDREKAVEYYNKFVELWKDADPELQPIVRDVRGRLANLVQER